MGMRPCETPDPEEDQRVLAFPWPGLCAECLGGQRDLREVSHQDSEVLWGRGPVIPVLGPRQKGM